jgi:hypothetical protein
MTPSAIKYSWNTSLLGAYSAISVFEQSFIELRIIAATTSTRSSNHTLMTIIERGEGFSELADSRLIGKAKWRGRLRLLKMFAAVFFLLVGLSFLNEVWHRHSADPLEVVVGALLASLGFILLWSEWKKQP